MRLTAVLLRSPERVSVAPGRWKTCGKNALPHGGPSPLDLLTNIYVLYETYSGASLRPSWGPERISLPSGSYEKLRIDYARTCVSRRCLPFTSLSLPPPHPSRGERESGRKISRFRSFGFPVGPLPSLKGGMERGRQDRWNPFLIIKI